MASFPGRLSAIQKKVLEAFFARESGFFLTGGGALVGFHLAHRTTDDLDLFTTDDGAFARSRFVLQSVAESLNANVSTRLEAPGFRRVVLATATEAVVVDLVLERVPQIHPTKDVVEGIRVDAADEVLANKLTTLVGRSEERDLVDVMALERAGFRIEDALPLALQKDGGCTPATLAWLLSEIAIPDNTPLPAGVQPAELREWIHGLVARLRRLAFPGDRKVETGE